MLQFEILAIILLCVVSLFAVMTGAFFSLLYHVNYLGQNLKFSKSRLEQKVNEFSEITQKASEANQSHANLLIEMKQELEFCRDRLNRLDNSIKMGGKANGQSIWKN